ncbi:MAG: type III pantothenate kinase, partial [Firmicutes bacterium]|nr:type III pantothenate kinase [Bacillota bacterium]
MLLGMNINNTHTLLGVFDGEELLADWRLATDRLRTPDEYGLIVTSLLATAGLDPKAVDGLIIASVVPPVTATFVEMCRRYFGREPMQVGPGTKTGLPIKYENPREVGADRVVNAVAGIK